MAARINWSKHLDTLDCSLDEYITRNAAGLTDVQLSQRLTPAYGSRISINAVTKRRGLVLGVAKTGGPNSVLRQVVSESPFTKYDSPPQIESDRVAIFPDIQAPYQDSSFINKVLDLCNSWDVKDAILAGDAIENSSLSHFDPAWVDEVDIHEGSLPDKIADELIDLMDTMPKAAKDKLRGFIEKKGRKSNKTASGAGQEWHHARIALREMCSQFDRMIWTIGNHEGRLLRQIQSPMLPQDVKRLFLGEDARVEIAPYYYCMVISGGETWRIIHPKSSGRGDAQWYCSKYLQHVIMAHSHHWLMAKDRSGRFFAIEAGAMVDENRLPYVSQRDTKMHKHLLGAVILRDGKPYLLGEDTDFELMKKM